AEREPELLREIHAGGHAIGNHTHTHPNMMRLSRAGVADELRRGRAAVEAAGVRFAEANGGMLMRPPYGLRRPGTLRAMRAEGYEPVIWSVTCFDWRRTATRRSIARHAAEAVGGDIILMHDGSDLEPMADRSRTIAAAESTLERYTAEGFEFVTVPELVSARGSQVI
ncbi:MAG: polysaccharide deacetylase family protein, partial [Solirubrobacterales bacterium]|nr:polysaccharide deacetylase family protein [Solirubrobacterales bacterium]